MTGQKGKTDFITLPDGRRLAFNRYGDPAGRSVFYFHGCPGSRLEVELSGATLPPAVGLISVDRPGIGGSDKKDGRTLLDWPRDVRALADSLDIERFFVVGVSGGGPYAAACAYAMPERIIGTALVCPLFPLHGTAALSDLAWRHRLIMQLAGCCPAALALVCGMIGRQIRQRPVTVLNFMAKAASLPDRRMLARPEVRELFSRSFRLAISASVDGVLQDLLIFARPWGFAVHDIRGRVDLWQGKADHTIPEKMGRRWAGELISCRCRFLPGQGHFSLPIDHFAEIVENLTAP
jgi:pimeloyl-ACP methyl ester carboxylesterase